MPRIATAPETQMMNEAYEKADLANLRALVAMLPDGMPLPQSLVTRLTELMKDDDR